MKNTVTQVIELVLLYAVLVSISVLFEPVSDYAQFAAHLGVVLTIAVIWGVTEDRIRLWEKYYLQ